jgi:hypothetical protein
MIEDHLPSSRNCCCSGTSSKLGSCGPSNCALSIVIHKYIQANNTINKKQYTNNINIAKQHYKTSVYVARVA